MLLVRYYSLLGILVGVVVVPAVTRESNSTTSPTTAESTITLSSYQYETSLSENSTTESSTVLLNNSNKTSITENESKETTISTTAESTITLSSYQYETSLSENSSTESSTVLLNNSNKTSITENESKETTISTTESTTTLSSEQTETIPETYTEPTEITNSKNGTSTSTTNKIDETTTTSAEPMTSPLPEGISSNDTDTPVTATLPEGISSTDTGTPGKCSGNSITDSNIFHQERVSGDTNTSEMPSETTTINTISTSETIDYTTYTENTFITESNHNNENADSTTIETSTNKRLPITTLSNTFSTIISSINTEYTTISQSPNNESTKFSDESTSGFTEESITTLAPPTTTILLPTTTIPPPTTTIPPPTTTIPPPHISTIPPPTTTIPPPHITTIPPPPLTIIPPRATTITPPNTTMIHNTTPHNLDDGSTVPSKPETNATTISSSTISSTAMMPETTTNASISTSTSSSTTPAPPDLDIFLNTTYMNSTTIAINWTVNDYYKRYNYNVTIIRADSKNVCANNNPTITMTRSCCDYIYYNALPGFKYTTNISVDKLAVKASTELVMPSQGSAIIDCEYDDITATTATIIMTKNNSKFDQPKYMNILISEEDEIKEEYCSLNDSDVFSQYQSVKIDWDSIEGETFKVVLGENNACPNSLATKNNCNRPLKPKQHYYVSIIFFYSNYYRIVPLHKSFTTDKESNLALALGLIFGLICVSVFGYSAVILWKKGYLKIINLTRCQSTHDLHPDDIAHLAALLPAEKAVTDDNDDCPRNVKVNEFVRHCEYLEKNPDKQHLQWEQLDAESKALDGHYNTNFAVLPENKRKNRYPNILPWDHCRVKLNIDEDDEICSDYINASYIKGASNKNEYIATQGPLAGTCRDFWKMVVQENVKIIVMVSKFIENNRDKCYKYFPKNHETMLVGEDIEVRCSTELHFGVYCVRTLQVRKDYTLVTVTHMQFLEWPDFGVPTGTENMLQFCHQLRNRWGSEGGLALVHCSAGVGRTGTLIATDILLQAIESESKISVYNTILEMRRQRRSMVQTQKQYMYIHQLIKSMLEDPIVPEPPNTEPVYENIIINTDQLKVDPLLDKDKIETAESAF
ncbi:uncharacterized protein LOC143194409 isoform X6 [Rhynchophorus ferrugineus]|uniref:uncharacterized protein LOC143194409 isoform X6 n=1 Tax=Rhynchophorus ferrugineus TaxID=354439 RepID=UPI003FCD8969